METVTGECTTIVEDAKGKLRDDLAKLVHYHVATTYEGTAAVQVCYRLECVRIQPNIALPVGGVMKSAQGAIMQAVLLAYREGVKSGYEDGYKEGYEDGQDD